MGIRNVKKELNNLDKSDIIKLVSDMYSKIPSVKEYLDVFCGEKIVNIAEKYKNEIEKYVFPSGRNMVLREKEARKLIRTVRKMKITELDIELELYYVECCLGVIQDFGYFDDDYYVAVEKMFNSAMRGISEIGIERKYETRIHKISEIASEYGIELYY